MLKLNTLAYTARIIKNYTYSLQGTQLERLEHMKDLGVIFDNELNFVQHCKEKINTAYSYLGIIKRNFIYLDEDAFFIIIIIINVKIIMTLSQKNAAGALYKTLYQNLQLTMCNKQIAQSCPVFKGCLE